MHHRVVVWPTCIVLSTLLRYVVILEDVLAKPCTNVAGHGGSSRMTLVYPITRSLRKTL